MAPIARLAPSPTGVLHLGNARTFLLAWLSARAQDAELLLRVEDIDGPRTKAEGERRAREDLRWLGLSWDREAPRQSERLGRYRRARQRLVELGAAYPCICTRKDIEDAGSAPHGLAAATRYPGTCRDRFRDADHARLESGREAAWRLRVSDDRVVTLADPVFGARDFALGDLGDCVIEKRDGLPAYQLAVVVDDGEQGVTEVVRGDDLADSTPWQLLLFEHLTLPAPARYLHVPLVIGPDGRRLAKRHGDTTVASFRQAGVKAEALIGWLAATCGLLPYGEQATAAELITGFGWAKLPRAPVIWHADRAREFA